MAENMTEKESAVKILNIASLMSLEVKEGVLILTNGNGTDKRTACPYWIALFQFLTGHPDPKASVIPGDLPGFYLVSFQEKEEEE